MKIQRAHFVTNTIWINSDTHLQTKPMDGVEVTLDVRCDEDEMEDQPQNDRLERTPVYLQVIFEYQQPATVRQVVNQARLFSGHYHTAIEANDIRVLGEHDALPGFVRFFPLEETHAPIYEVLRRARVHTLSEQDKKRLESIAGNVSIKHHTPGDVVCGSRGCRKIDAPLYSIGLSTQIPSFDYPAILRIRHSFMTDPVFAAENVIESRNCCLHHSVSTDVEIEADYSF